MEQKFILTAFGKDRPGIVAEITEIIYENKCNLEDSNMGRLADEFTLILLLTGNSKDDLQDRLSRECRRLEREKDIFCFIRPLDFQQPDNGNRNNLHTIEVEGVDQAGIVYKVARLLAAENINIETLNSKKKFSPNSGTAMYVMNITATLPKGMAVEAVDSKLDELANELHVDITIT